MTTPVDTSFAALNASFAVDATSVGFMKEKLQEIATHLGPIVKSVAPVFGAYMRYSAVLEFGWRDGRTANFRVPPGGTVTSDHGVPHMYPAVRKNAGDICAYIKDNSVMPLMDKLIAGKNPNVSKPAEVKQLERAWIRILNDKPRRDAVARAPYKYGFHRRSIQGSAYPLPSADIMQMRQQAAAEAKKLNEALADKQAKKKWAKKAKKLAKKRGGRVLNPKGL